MLFRVIFIIIRIHYYIKMNILYILSGACAILYHSYVQEYAVQHLAAGT